MKTRLRSCWCAIKQRCLNPNNPSYKYYGGRRIGICAKWMRFEPFRKWAISNGYQDNLTIERINNNGDYEPSNCTWITKAKQHSNTQQSHRITFMGRTQLLSQWAQEYGIKPTTLLYRLKSEWPIDKALKTKPKYNNTRITFHGKTQTLSQWSKELGINHTTLYMRINHYCWPVERALLIPVRL